MYQYAIDEVPSLLGKLPAPLDAGSPAIRYVCALFAELAYYHIPQWELDGRKRAKLIPCEAYRVLAARGSVTNVASLLQELEFPRAFVVAERGAIAVGVMLNRVLFIGFRGTQFLFDWRINVQSRLAPIVFGGVSGGVHSGFAEEALRISRKISGAISESKLGNIDHVFLTGHSLGGAIAALSAYFLGVAPMSLWVFGAPRYADLVTHISLSYTHSALVRRPGDLVPTLPPRAFGYIDHPNEFRTDGTPYFDGDARPGTLGSLWNWIRFLMGRFEPHDMELYRQELGLPAGASAACARLAPFKKLAAGQIVRDPYIIDVVLAGDEAGNSLLVHEVHTWPHVQSQSRFIAPTCPNTVRVRIFSDQLVSEDEVGAVAVRLGLKVLATHSAH